MGRRLLLRTSEYPYHITARANNKEWFTLPNDQTWALFCRHLQETQKKFNLEIHAALMMSNHLHMIISTPDENIDKAMHYFMTMTSKEIGFLTNRINKVWGSRYYRCLINKEDYYAHAYKYLYTNPLKAKIAVSVDDYRWSTLKPENYSKHRDLKITSREGFDAFIPTDRIQLLAWLNQKDDLFYTDHVRKALKKGIFEFSKKEEVIKYEYFRNFLLKK